jgi:hypothetical protein
LESRFVATPNTFLLFRGWNYLLSEKREKEGKRVKRVEEELEKSYSLVYLQIFNEQSSIPQKNAPSRLIIIIKVEHNRVSIVTTEKKSGYEFVNISRCTSLNHTEIRIFRWLLY